MNCRPLLLFVTASRDATLTVTDECGRILYQGTVFSYRRRTLCLPHAKRLILAVTRGDLAEYRYLLATQGVGEISAFFDLTEPSTPSETLQQFTLVDETYSLPVNSATLRFNG